MKLEKIFHEEIQQFLKFGWDIKMIPWTAGASSRSKISQLFLNLLSKIKENRVFFSKFCAPLRIYELGVTFNSDKLGGIDFIKFSKLSMCSAGAGRCWLVQWPGLPPRHCTWSVLKFL